MVKSDKWIKQMSFEYKMIEPFEERQMRDGKISFGTSSYGYDMRLSNEFMVIDKVTKEEVVDPKKMPEKLFENIKVKDCIVIPPNSIVLGKTIEYFRIPKNILTITFGKSTYARCGIFVNVTPFEPEWEGKATIPIVNTVSVPVKVYVNEGIAQVLFLETGNICDISYADRGGKYQKQKTITPAKI
ncbi:MAG: dCTP deaminase [Endomicrobium sp.]|jgi:dCTP deaminase|nr:dCTP deaminase [Endomicrobium sp.]